MAFRRKIGGLAQMLLQQHLQQRGREDIAQQQAGLQLIEAIRTNPQLATKLSADHPGMMIGGMPVGYFAQSPDEALNASASDLASVSDLTKLPGGEADVEALYHKHPGALKHGQDRPAIEQLMAQAAKRREGITSGITGTKRAESVPQAVKSMNAQGVEQVQYMNPFDAADQGPLPVERTQEQEGARQGTIKGAEEDAKMVPGRIKARVSEAGRTAGASAAAQSPVLLDRAKQLATYDNDLKKDFESFKQKNDVTGSTKTMMEGAAMVLPHIQKLRVQADALDRAGYFGPVMSRIRHLGEKAGTVEEWEQAINTDPELQNDRRVGQFATELGLLGSGAARVHGGARGGGSPMMLQYMKGLLSDAGSLQMFMGRMDSVEGYMKGYAAGPHATPDQGPELPVNPVVESAVEKMRRRNGGSTRR